MGSDVLTAEVYCDVCALRATICLSQQSVLNVVKGYKKWISPTKVAMMTEAEFLSTLNSLW